VAGEDGNFELGVKLKGESTSLVQESKNAADSLKGVEEQARRTGQALADEGRSARTAAEEQRRLHDERSRAIEQANRAQEAEARRKWESSALKQQLEAQREAQAALNNETERGTNAMRGATAETLAMTAAKNGLRSAMSALSNIFTGPGGIIATIAAAALSWSAFGNEAAEAGRKAEEAAKKSKPPTSRYMVQGVDYEEQRAKYVAEIARLGDEISNLTRKGGEHDLALAEEYRGKQKYMAGWIAGWAPPTEAAAPPTVGEATRGLRTATSARAEFDERVATLYKAYQPRLDYLSIQPGNPELAGVQADLLENYGAARKAYEQQLKGLGPKEAKDSKAGHRPDQDFERLFKQANDMVAVTEAQLDSTVKLTQAEQMRARVMKEVEEGILDLSPTEERIVVTLLDKASALQKEEAQRKAAAKSIEDYNKAQEQFLTRQQQDVTQRETANRKLQEHNEQIGASTEELGRLRIARAEEALALERHKLALTNVVEASAGELEMQQRRVELAEKAVQLARDGAVRAVSAEQNREAAAENKRIADNLERALTDSTVRGLMAGFRRGESVWKNFIDRMKEGFATAILTPIIQPIMRPIANMMAGAVQGIGQSLFGGGGGGAASLFGGGSNPIMNAMTNFNPWNTMSDIGSWVGGVFSGGTSLLGGTSAAAGFDIALGGLGGTAGAEALGAGALSGVSTALPWIGAGLFAANALGLFGDDEDEPPPGYRHANWLNLNRDGNRFRLGSSELPNVEQGIAFLNQMNERINDPTLFDQDILAKYVGQQFTGGVGEDAQGLFQRFLQAAEPAAAAAAETLRLEQERAKVIREQVDANLRLSDAVARFKKEADDLLLSGLSPLTQQERLDVARTSYGQVLEAARAGDTDALQRYGSSAQDYLREAAAMYGTSTPTYRAMFEGALSDRSALTGDLENMVVDQLAESALQFKEMNLSLERIDASLKDLPVAVADAFKKATEDSARDIIEALLQQGIDIRNGVQGAIEAGARA
jgi:hypothetical protein